MQTVSSYRFAALALGTTAFFDVTGAVIYRVVRAGLPTPPPPDSAAGPFRQATRELRDAHHEAISRARAKGGVNLPA
jgi:hypothetical protein